MFNGYWCNFCKIKWWMKRKRIIPGCEECGNKMIEIGSDGINGQKEYLGKE